MHVYCPIILFAVSIKKTIIGEACFVRPDYFSRKVLICLATLCIRISWPRVLANGQFEGKTPFFFLRILYYVLCCSISLTDVDHFSTTFCIVLITLSSVINLCCLLSYLSFLNDPNTFEITIDLLNRAMFGCLFSGNLFEYVTGFYTIFSR